MKKIFVVSTLHYKRLEVVLEDLIKVLEEEDPKERYEFYIVNEIFGSKAPENVKFKNYIHTSDSTDDDEMKKIYECVREWPNCDYELQTDEYAITILALINSELGRKGLTLEQESKFRDKVRMKQNLRADVDKPILYTLEDVKNDNVRYPVIIKPRTFAASKGVYKIENREELQNALSDKQVDYTRPSIDTMDDYEIEECIDGDVYHIDGIVYEGKIVFCVGSKYMGSCFKYAQGEILGSIKLEENQQKEARTFTEKVHRDLNIPNGVFHLEAFYRDKNFVFLEIGIRPGGAGVIPSIKAGTGIDLAKEHIKCQLDIKPGITKKIDQAFGWLNFPCIHEYENEKHVKSITLPDINFKSLQISKTPNVGDIATADFVNYGNSLGEFVFVHKDIDILEKEIYSYAEKYKVLVG